MKTLNHDPSFLEVLNINTSPNEYSLNNEEKSMVHLAFRELFTKKLTDLKVEHKLMSGWSCNERH